MELTTPAPPVLYNIHTVETELEQNPTWSLQRTRDILPRVHNELDMEPFFHKPHTPGTS